MSSRPGAEAARPHRAGTVAIVGRPNVGKSTLLNRLIGAKLSITSRRPQTTRRRITGILTRPDAQIVFIDTPGYQTEHAGALNRAMNRSVAATLQEADVVVWMVEALRYDGRDEQVARLLPEQASVVVAINKSDAVRDKKALLPFIEKLAVIRPFEAIVPVSALRGRQLDDLVRTIVGLLPEGPPLYDPDELTTVSERVLAAELIREKLYHQLAEELPYAATVEIERFREERGLRRIEAAILVDRESHRPIVIGRGGERLKSIASHARRDMERLFGGKVFLQVWVKVRRGWAESEAALKRLGLNA